MTISGIPRHGGGGPPPPAGCGLVPVGPESEVRSILHDHRYPVDDYLGHSEVRRRIDDAKVPCPDAKLECRVVYEGALVIGRVVGEALPDHVLVQGIADERGPA